MCGRGVFLGNQPRFPNEGVLPFWDLLPTPTPFDLYDQILLYNPSVEEACF